MYVLEAFWSVPIRFYSLDPINTQIEEEFITLEKDFETFRYAKWSKSNVH